MCIHVALNFHTIRTNRNPSTDRNLLWFVSSSGVFSDGNLTYGIEPLEGDEVSLDCTTFNKPWVHLFSRRVVCLIWRSLFPATILLLDVIQHWSTGRIFQSWSGFISICGPTEAELNYIDLEMDQWAPSSSLKPASSLSLSFSPRLSNSDGSFS